VRARPFVLGAIFCALFISVAASGKPIDGQVFIVTAEQQAIKLALVQVMAVAQADAEKHISETNAALDAERAKADAAVKESTEAVRRAKWVIRGGFGEWVEPLSGPGILRRNINVKYNASTQEILRRNTSIPNG